MRRYSKEILKYEKSQLCQALQVVKIVQQQYYIQWVVVVIHKCTVHKVYTISSVLSGQTIHNIIKLHGFLFIQYDYYVRLNTEERKISAVNGEVKYYYTKLRCLKSVLHSDVDWISSLCLSNGHPLYLAMENSHCRLHWSWIAEHFLQSPEPTLLPGLK